MSSDQLTVRTYPGAGSVLLAFDFPAQHHQDLAGFAIHFTGPDGSSGWLTNRLTFDDPVTSDTTPEQRQLITTTTKKAPLQKFHWTHFPPNVIKGQFTYRVVAMMFSAGSEQDVVVGPSAEVSVELVDDGHPSFTLGFTRGYISSQAYAERFHNADYEPSPQTIDFATAPFEQQYQWLGFDARRLIFAFLAEALGDPTCTLDVFAYDFNEPDVIRQLAAMKSRLRIFLDDSDSHVIDKKTGHVPLEQPAKAALQQANGPDNVKVGHFQRFAHSKVMILKRDGVPTKVLSGSANFSLRGLYVQSNNVFVIDDPQVAGWYEQAFQQAWETPSAAAFAATKIAGQWNQASSPRLPPMSVAFSPHTDGLISLGPVADAIRNAKSSVLFAVMEIGAGSGPVLDEVRRLPERKDLYAFGTTQRLDGALSVTKPGQASAFIPFAYLRSKVPPPFQPEISGGAGQVIHHKFVVVDFNDDNPVVFAGSSNLAQGGEEQNGDNLIAIRDPVVATAYAVAAIQLIDHYRFRVVQQASSDAAPLRLKRRSENWAADYYDPASPKFRERELFANPTTSRP